MAPLWAGGGGETPLARVGVKVGIRVIPSEVYYGGGDWLEADPAFDELVARIDREMHEGRRVGLYHQAQEILIERGPLIVPYFAKAVAGVRSDLQGINLASDWPRTRFGEAYFGR